MDFDGAASDGRGGHSDSANSDIVSVPEDGGGGGVVVLGKGEPE